MNSSWSGAGVLLINCPGITGPEWPGENHIVQVAGWGSASYSRSKKGTSIGRLYKYKNGIRYIFLVENGSPASAAIDVHTINLYNANTNTDIVRNLD